MKTIAALFFILVLELLSAQAFAQQSLNLSNVPLNHPGIKWDWKIKADQYTFTVDTVSNYDMQNVTFNKDSKTLSFFGNSSHTGNIAEIQVPHDLIDGNLTVYQNGKQLFPLVIKSGDTTLVVLKFNDTGLTTTNIIGTTYLPEFSGIESLVMVISFAILLTFKVRSFQ